MNKNTILISVVSLATAGAAYFYFFTGTGNEPPLSAIPEPSTTQTQFKILSGKLPPSFDLSIFSDRHFTELVDITQPVQKEPSGRLDPFAPLNGVSIPQ